MPLQAQAEYFERLAERVGGPRRADWPGCGGEVPAAPLRKDWANPYLT